MPMVTGLGFGVTSGVKAVEGEKATLEFKWFDPCPIFSQSRFIHGLIHLLYSLDEWFVGTAASCGGGKRFKEKDSCTVARLVSLALGCCSLLFLRHSGGLAGTWFGEIVSRDTIHGKIRKFFFATPLSTTPLMIRSHQNDPESAQLVED